MRHCRHGSLERPPYPHYSDDSDYDSSRRYEHGERLSKRKIPAVKCQVQNDESQPTQEGNYCASDLCAQMVHKRYSDLQR
jgi:hypothetical protein